MSPPCDSSCDQPTDTCTVPRPVHSAREVGHTGCLAENSKRFLNETRSEPPPALIHRPKRRADALSAFLGLCSRHTILVQRMIVARPGGVTAKSGAFGPSAHRRHGCRL